MKNRKTIKTLSIINLIIPIYYIAYGIYNLSFFSHRSNNLAWTYLADYSDASGLGAYIPLFILMFLLSVFSLIILLKSGMPKLAYPAPAFPIAFCIWFFATVDIHNDLLLIILSVIALAAIAFWIYVLKTISVANSVTEEEKHI